MTMKCGKKKLKYGDHMEISCYFLCLTGQAREFIVGLDISKLSCDQGAENLID